MSDVRSSEDVDFDSEVPALIVGAGAAGLIAALTLSEAGIEPVVIERDAVPSGSTALSAGLIPAAGTRFQRARGITDSAKLFGDDIARKAHGEADGKPNIPTNSSHSSTSTNSVSRIALGHLESVFI